MKAVGYTVALTAIVGFISISVQGAKSHSLNERPFVMGRPHPALVGIDELRAILLRSGADLVIDGLHWTQLKADVIDQLNQAQIKLLAGPVDGSVSIPELRVYINLLKLEDSQQYVFRIQTSVARAVCLEAQDHPIFKANLWTLNPIFEAVSVDDMPARMTEVVLAQIKAFIRAYRTANPQGKSFSDSRMNKSDSLTFRNQTETNVKSSSGQRGYVASNNSDIFHKPDCRWAKNISPDNLVTYKSRQEAVKAGKRPCKWCKP